MGEYGVDVHPIYQESYQYSNPFPIYAWIKVSDGSRPYTKKTPDALAARGKAKGTAMGGYHYAQPVSRTGGVGPEVQADILCNEVLRLGITRIVAALDIEDDPNQYNWPASEARDFILRFKNRQRARGVGPGVYMNDAMAAKLGRSFMDMLFADGVVLWIARYASDGVTRLRPRNTAFDVHQYSSTNPSLDKNESFNNKVYGIATGGQPPAAAQFNVNLEEAEMQTLPASAEDTSVALALPGLACRIVITPGVKPDGSTSEVFVRGIKLSATYPGSEDLGTIKPEIVDPEGVGHITKPEYFVGHPDALMGILTYSATAPFSVAVYRV